MSEKLVQDFIDALGRLEQQRELDPLVALFADDCEVGNVTTQRSFEGRKGAAEFWRIYRGSFDRVASSFRNVVVAGDRAVLEWTTEYTVNGEEPARYEGVSMLELAGDRIRRFYAYFDASKLGRQLSNGRVASGAEDDEEDNRYFNPGV